MASHDRAEMDQNPRHLPQPPSIASTPSSASASVTSLLTPPALPPRPRFVRSATNLKADYVPHHTVIEPEEGELPMKFALEYIPTLRPSTASTHDEAQLRRVRSSPALAVRSVIPRKPLPVREKDDAAQQLTDQVDGDEELEQDSVTAKSKWKTVLGEAQYFAGGLISHPWESTRRYSIIRHSHALVWYRGPYTSIPVTILSNIPLPLDRKMWMQQKGFSGKVGMGLKALAGNKSDWIDVTPSSRAAISDLSVMDERSMQRDLQRFVKKASSKTKDHLPRETHVIRIPALAEDGYFRLVLCAGEDGKQVLCGSPVFRIASTSTDISSMRGSSLSTMPIELGVKVAGIVGQQYARRYVGVASVAVQTGAKRFIPNEHVRSVGSAVLRHGPGLAKGLKTSSGNEQDPLANMSALDCLDDVVGSVAGPEPPFPLKFSGKVVKGTGYSTIEYDLPTANLRDVPDLFEERFNGIFLAWASIVQKGKEAKKVPPEWFKAVVRIAVPENTPQLVRRNRVSVHLIHDLEDATLVDKRLKVLLLGMLRTLPNAAEINNERELRELEKQDSSSDGHHLHQKRVESYARDVKITMQSLEREEWSAEACLDRLKVVKSDRGLKERAGEVNNAIQTGVKTFPLHRAGMRTDAGKLRDVVLGIGGLWIPR